MSVLSANIIMQCAINLVHPETLNAIIQTESHYNPFAIAVVDGKQIPQPKTRLDAEIAISNLEAQGLNYSVGLGQINKGNFKKYNVTGKELLDPCTNLKISSDILSQCYKSSPDSSVAEALSCYYAGNFSYGFIREKNYKNTAYVERVIENYKPQSEFYVPSIKAEIPTALSKIRDPKLKSLTAKNQVERSEKKSPVVLKAKSNMLLVKNMPKEIDKDTEIKNNGKQPFQF